MSSGGRKPPLGLILRAMWHDYSPPIEGNHQCVDCDVIVDESVVDEVMLGCPVPPCPEPANEGQPCVFVPSEDGAECSYCGRRGGEDPDTP